MENHIEYLRRYLRENDLSQARQAIDVDQTLLGGFMKAAQLIERETGRPSPFESMTEYPRPGLTIFGLPYEKYSEFYERGWSQEYATIPRLANEVDLTAVWTAAQSKIVMAGVGNKIESVKRAFTVHFPSIAARLADNIVPVPKGGDKAQLPFDIFYDDAPRLAQSVARNPEQVLLLIDACYNRGLNISAKNVIRVRDFGHARQLIAPEVVSEPRTKVRSR
jgi:hypothetical protein